MERLEGLLEGLGGKEEKGEKSKNLLAVLASKFRHDGVFPSFSPNLLCGLLHYTLKRDLIRAGLLLEPHFANH